MGQLHLRKIDLADEVFVVNVDDYIGESTQKEIAYARKHGKALRWYTHDPVGEKTKEMFIIADYKSKKRLDEVMLRWQEQESIKEEKAQEHRECWQFPGR